MKKSIGKLLIVCILMMLLGMENVAFNLTEVQATNKSQSEAMNWVRSQVGRSIDYDGAYGAQCVDLILAYYNYLGVPTSWGHAYQYATNVLPDGWSRIQGAIPQKGDILVYGQAAEGDNGHVAIYESDTVTYHQNFSSEKFPNANLVQKVTGITYNRFDKPYWGVIRPNFAGSDTILPTISDICVTNVTRKSYTVTCTVSDNTGITSVKFPTWSDYNSQDDLVWYEGNLNGNTASITIDTSKHTPGYGRMVTHIYAYDASGNQVSKEAAVLIQKEYIPLAVTTANGHVYAIFEDQVDWNTAKSVCESMGGHLVTITSAQETQTVNELLAQGSSLGYHFGLYEKAEGNWNWVTGEKFSYQNWNNNEPDNLSGYANEDLGAIHRPSTKWCDIATNDKFGFILEIDTKLKPGISYNYDKLKYEIYNTAMPYAVAKAYCEATGGKLAVVDSQAKNNAIANIIKKQGCSKYYIGCERADVNANWKDTNGKAQTYFNWIPSQPDGHLGIQNVATMTLDGTWDDEYAYGSHIGFVKEVNIASVSVSPVKTTYNVGDVIDLSSIKVYIKYGDGSSKRIINGFKVSGVSTDYAGTFSATVQYGNYKKTIRYTIKLPASAYQLTRSASYKSVYVRWNKVDHASGYRILMATTSKGTYKVVKTVTGNSKNATTINNLDTSKVYYFKIQAYQSTPNGIKYATASAYKTGKCTLGTVKMKSVQNVGSGQMKLTWGKVSGAYGYEIYRSTMKNGGYKKYATRNGSSMLSTTLRNQNGKYYYKVRAYRIVNSKKVYGNLSAVIQ